MSLTARVRRIGVEDPNSNPTTAVDLDLDLAPGNDSAAHPSISQPPALQMPDELRQIVNDFVGHCCWDTSRRRSMFRYQASPCTQAAPNDVDLSALVREETCYALNWRSPCLYTGDTTNEECAALLRAKAAVEGRPTRGSDGKPLTCCCRRILRLPHGSAGYDAGLDSIPLCRGGSDIYDSYCCKAHEGRCPLSVAMWSRRGHALCGLPTKPEQPEPAGCFTCKEKPVPCEGCLEGLAAMAGVKASTKEPRSKCPVEVFKRAVAGKCRGLYPADCAEHPDCVVSSYGQCVGAGDEHKDRQKCSAGCVATPAPCRA